MTLIPSAQLLGIADRVARQYGKVKAAFTTMNATSTYSSYFTYASTGNYPDVEIPLDTNYYAADNNITLANTVRSGMTQLLSIVTTMDSHFSRVGSTGSWDGYLTYADERVSDNFNQVAYLAKSQYLLANNVFSEGADLFGTVEIAAGPSIDFTDGINYGNGSATNRASGSYFAATQLRVKVVGGALGATDLDLRITGKDKNNAVATVDVTVTANTPENTYVDCGTSTDRFLDVTSVAYQPAGDQGTVGDTVEIYNLKERTIDVS